MSEKRLMELAEGLSEEGREIFVRVIKMGQDRAEDERIDQAAAVEALAGFEDLPQGDKDRLASFVGEMRDGYDRMAKEAQGEAALLGQLAGVFERAEEVSGTKPETVGEAVSILEKYGIKHGFSEEVTEMELEVPVEGEGSWYALPTSEVPTDENGIPTKKVVPKGFGIPDGAGGIIKLDRMEAEAMRLTAKINTYEECVRKNRGDWERQGITRR
jgi:hypothetical protein